MRRIIIDQSHRAGVGHIGSALSVVEILACLYGGAMQIEHPADLERDRFILSKGHAALALYAALSLRGWIDQEQLDSFCGNGTLLGVHPEHQLAGVDFSSGSLGQGLSYAVGAALAAKRQGSARRIFVLLSDAECNEGAVWESAMFAAHHKLDNLVAIIDANRQQAFGKTEDVLDLSPLENRWRAFGWNAIVVDGHDFGQITNTISSLAQSAETPHVLVANTTFGKGISFMQSQIKWHYWPLSETEYRLAIAELEGAS
jgi:transketolase